MVNKCVIVGCKSGYLGNEGISSFRFPFGKPVLLIIGLSLLIEQTGNLQTLSFVQNILRRNF